MLTSTYSFWEMMQHVCTLSWFHNYFVFFMQHVTVCVHIVGNPQPTKGTLRPT